MKVLVCGAGQVGYNIAKQLIKEDNEVTLIDQDPELIQNINDSLDARAYLGHAAHPNVLEAAGAADADMLIAVTYSDEVNMVACQIAYSLFSIPTKIARVRHQNYLNPIWKNLYSNNHLAIDVIISPEIEVADAVLRRLHAPGATDMIPFGNNLRVMGVRCMHDCPIINLPLNLLRQKTQHLKMNIIGIIHDGKFSLPTPETILHEGDDVYFVAEKDDVRKSMAIFGHEEREARRVLVLGGGNIGLYIAQQLEADEEHETTVKVIEYNKERAQHVATRLNDTTVLNGSALEREILTEAGIELTETVIAVTNDDETNILSSLLAKRYGCERAISLVNNNSYAPLLANLGVDVVVNPRETTVSSILQHVRRGKIRAVHSISDGMAEIIEAEAVETSSLVGKTVADLNLPKGVMLCAVVHQGEVIMPEPDTVIQDHDTVLLVATTNMIKKVERIFSVSLEYF